MLSPRNAEKIAQSLGSSVRAIMIAASEVATTVSACDANSWALSVIQPRVQDDDATPGRPVARLELGHHTGLTT